MRRSISSGPGGLRRKAEGVLHQLQGMDVRLRSVEETRRIAEEDRERAEEEARRRAIAKEIETKAAIAEAIRRQIAADGVEKSTLETQKRFLEEQIASLKARQAQHADDREAGGDTGGTGSPVTGSARRERRSSHSDLFTPQQPQADTPQADMLPQPLATPQSDHVPRVRRPAPPSASPPFSTPPAASVRSPFSTTPIGAAAAMQALSLSGGFLSPALTMSPPSQPHHRRTQGGLPSSSELGLGAPPGAAGVPRSAAASAGISPVMSGLRRSIGSGAGTPPGAASTPSRAAVPLLSFGRLPASPAASGMAPADSAAPPAAVSPPPPPLLRAAALSPALVAAAASRTPLPPPGASSAAASTGSSIEAEPSSEDRDNSPISLTPQSLQLLETQYNGHELFAPAERIQEYKANPAELKQLLDKQEEVINDVRADTNNVAFVQSRRHRPQKSEDGKTTTYKWFHPEHLPTRQNKDVPYITYTVNNETGAMVVDYHGKMPCDVAVFKNPNRDKDIDKQKGAQVMIISNVQAQGSHVSLLQNKDTARHVLQGDETNSLTAQHPEKQIDTQHALAMAKRHADRELDHTSGWAR